LGWIYSLKWYGVKVCKLGSPDVIVVDDYATVCG
jgi:hypothetical protein